MIVRVFGKNHTTIAPIIAKILYIILGNGFHTNVFSKLICGLIKLVTPPTLVKILKKNSKILFFFRKKNIAILLGWLCFLS